MVTAQLISAFAIAKYAVLSNPFTSLIRKFESLAIVCESKARFVSDLDGNPEDRFCRVAANFTYINRRDIIKDLILLLPASHNDTMMMVNQQIA